MAPTLITEGQHGFHGLLAHTCPLSTRLVCSIQRGHTLPLGPPPSATPPPGQVTGRGLGDILCEGRIAIQQTIQDSGAKSRNNTFDIVRPSRTTQVGFNPNAITDCERKNRPVIRTLQRLHRPLRDLLP